jgi:hypothetical protein
MHEKQADQSRSDRQFKVGDRVFIKLHPYVQSSLSPRANQNLSFKYFGPFPIIQHIGIVAYKFLLPATSSIHPVFHVSQLKPAVLGTKVSSAFPSDIELPRFLEKILQHLLGSSAGKQVPQVQVQWSNWPPELATWENLEDLRQHFSNSSCLGSSSISRREIVSNLPVQDSEGIQGKDDGPRRGTRPRKPTVRVDGPEWVAG